MFAHALQLPGLHGFNVPCPTAPFSLPRAATLPEAPSSHASALSGDVFSQTHPYSVEQVLSLLNTGVDASILFVDIRSNSLYAVAHIAPAISACVPTTLLKRNSFTLDKIIGTGLMRDLTHIDKLRRWQEYFHIVVYDEHSRNCVENGAVSGLCGKFIAQNVVLMESGLVKNIPRIGFLVGGFEGFAATPAAEAYIAFESTVKIQVSSDDQSSLGSHASSGVLPALLLTGEGIPLSKQSQMDTYMGSSAQQPSSHAHDTPFLDVFINSLKRTVPHVEEAKAILTPNRELVHPIRLPPHDPADIVKLPEWLRSVCRDPRQINTLFNKVEAEEQHRLYRLLKFHNKADLNTPSVWGRNRRLQGRSSATNLRLQPTTPGSPTKRRRLTVTGVDASEEASTERSALAAVRNPNLNRYHNIWPYDQTRVRLQPSHMGSTVSPSIGREQEMNDEGYINASWVADGAYIVSQAPMQTTLGDFAKLVWQENVRVIVALTAEYDAGLGCFGTTGEGMGRHVCERYWPHEGEQLALGLDFVVTLLDEYDICAGQVSVRRIQLLQMPTFTVRMLVQIQYHGWPDHSVPDSPETLLRVQLLCRSLASNDPSPILVHCTAGCGRTGTFCAINMSIQALDQTPSIDPVAKAFQQLRLDRMEMVQTQRQLAFCYEACAWWFLSPLQ